MLKTLAFIIGVGASVASNAALITNTVDHAVDIENTAYFRHDPQIRIGANQDYSFGDMTLAGRDGVSLQYVPETFYYERLLPGQFNYSDYYRYLVVDSSLSATLSGENNYLSFTLRNSIDNLQNPVGDPSVNISFTTSLNNVYNYTIADPGMVDRGRYSVPTGAVFGLSGNEYFTGFTMTPASSRGIAINTISYGTIAAPVPEPETYALMGLGLAGVAFVARKRRPKSAA
jgi:hypothetical protein